MSKCYRLISRKSINVEISIVCIFFKDNLYFVRMYHKVLKHEKYFRQNYAGIISLTWLDIFCFTAVQCYCV